MTAPALILLGLLWLTIITTELVTARVPSSPAEQSPTSSRPCHQLPVSGFLTAQQLDMICHHREQWIKDRDSQSSKAVLEQTTGTFRGLAKTSPAAGCCSARGLIQLLLPFLLKILQISKSIKFFKILFSLFKKFADFEDRTIFPF